MIDELQTDARDESESEADTMRNWAALMERCSDLLPLFADIRLKVREASAVDALRLASRKVLRQLLRSRKLPPFLVLRDWCYVVQLVDRFGLYEDSIGQWAMQRGEYASVYYTFVERVTDLRWTDLRRHGPLWARARALHMWHPYMVDLGKP